MPTQNSWLDDLKDRHPAKPQTIANRRSTISPGDICRATPMDRDQPAAIVMVINSELSTQSHTVVLLTPDIDFGGDTDLVIRPAETGLPYSLLVQSDVFGYLWTVQLDKTLARASNQVVQFVESIWESQGAEVAAERRAGTPITTRADVRWKFKQTELVRLSTLTGPCTRQLIDGEPHMLVDPVALIPDGPSHSGSDLDAYVLALAERTATGEVFAPAWLMDALLADARLIRRYRATGHFDAYATLVGLVESWLPILHQSPVPEMRTSAGGIIAPEQLRDMLIEYRREQGETSVWIMTRETSPHRRPHRRTNASGDAIQCVFVPAESLFEEVVQ